MTDHPPGAPPEAAPPRSPTRDEMIAFCGALADEFESAAHSAFMADAAQFGASTARMLMLRYVAAALLAAPLRLRSEKEEELQNVTRVDRKADADR